jgi:hypothetical protein
MIGRRAVIGLSLLSALVFCAFAAQSASAAEGKNTTAFTCVFVGDHNQVFEDAHCDRKHPTGQGDYTHKNLPVSPPETTEIEITNKETTNETKEAKPAVLFGEPFKVKTEITCKTVSGTGTIGNTEPSAKVHKVSGKITTEFGIKASKDCTVIKPEKCTVKEPIVATAEAEGVEELEGKKEMGVEFRPLTIEGKKQPFAVVTLEGAECPIKVPFNVEGTAISTGGTTTQAEKHGGATAIFTKAMTEKTLKTAEKFAWFEAAGTVRMKGGGNPISLTTVT